jgi:heme exporter protein B
MNFWNKVIAILWKDILSEMRAREIIITVLVFTLLIIVIFNFAFGANQQMIQSVAPGMLWVTFAFAGVLSLNRSFVSEKQEGCIEGLMGCPVNREVIYAGKMLGSLVFMLIIEVIALPAFALLFNLEVLSLQIIVITLLTTVGFATVGTLFSALAANTKAREMVLPILFFPIVVPIIVCAIKATDAAFSGGSWGDLSPWIQIIMAFDAIFLVAAFWIFEYVIEE